MPKNAGVRLQSIIQQHKARVLGDEHEPSILGAAPANERAEVGLELRMLPVF